MALENPVHRIEVRDFFPRDHSEPDVETMRTDWSWAATPSDQRRARKWRERVMEMRERAEQERNVQVISFLDNHENPQ